MRATFQRAARRVYVFAQRLLKIKNEQATNNNNSNGGKLSALSKEARRLYKWVIVHPDASLNDLFGIAGPKLQPAIIPAKKAEYILRRKETIKRLGRPNS